jgi:hypothetical protein
MDGKGWINRTLLLLWAVCLTFSFSACRTRTTGNDRGQADTAAFSGAGEAEEPGEIFSDAAYLAAVSENGENDGANGETGGRTRENPDAARKEYDEDAPAEIVPGTNRLIRAAGEGEAAAVLSEGDALEKASLLNERAEETATQTVAAQEAEEMGVSEDAEPAESALTYFTVLLRDRTESLFECKRVNAYWETASDHMTVHKSSPEHGLILEAGAYDVSARLLPENLRVDDGWVTRKNPQVIVKIVDGEILGSGVHSAAAAKAVYESLCAREGWTAMDAVKNRQVLLLSAELLEAPYLQTAAALLIAKTAYPELFADVDADQAVNMLSEEEAGTLPTGIYYFSGLEE